MDAKLSCNVVLDSINRGRKVDSSTVPADWIQAVDVITYLSDWSLSTVGKYLCLKN